MKTHFDINKKGSYYKITTDEIHINLDLNGYGALGESLYIKYIIRTIIHENMHRAIYKATKSNITCALFDFVEIDKSITNYVYSDMIQADTRKQIIQYTYEEEIQIYADQLPNKVYNGLMSHYHNVILPRSI